MDIHVLRVPQLDCMLCGVIVIARDEAFRLPIRGGQEKKVGRPTGFTGFTASLTRCMHPVTLRGVEKGVGEAHEHDW